MTPLTKEKLEFAFPQMLKAMTRLGKSLQNPTVRTYIHRTIARAIFAFGFFLPVHKCVEGGTWTTCCVFTRVVPMGGMG